MALSKEDKVSRVRAELSIAEQIGTKPNLTHLAKKYDLAYSTVRSIHQGKYEEKEDEIINVLVETPVETLREVTEAIVASKPDKPIEVMEAEINYIAEGAKGLQKLRYNVQVTAQKAIDRIDRALDVEDNQQPRDIKYLVDALAAVNSSFFKDNSTNITVNNTSNHLALFRENLKL